MPVRMKLTDIDIIDHLKSADYQEFYNIFQERIYSKKQIISLPNNEEDVVLLVKSGRVRVFLSYEDKEFTLALLEQGDIYTTHTRAFTQALDEDTVLLVASTKRFGQMLSSLPQFSLIMVKALGDLLRNSITIINGLVFKETHSRLAEFLVQAAQEKGELVGNEIKLKLGLNMEELATILGATRQTVSLLLNDFYKTGILKKENRQTIIIRDLETLQKSINEKRI
ncbi:MAG: Crp/Fnr family transcriptional regulator [Thermincolia bacterium]